MSSTRERDAEIRSALARIADRPLTRAMLRDQFKSLGVQVDETPVVVSGTLVTDKDGEVGLFHQPFIGTGNWHVCSAKGTTYICDATDDKEQALAAKGFKITKHTIQSVLPCE